MRQIVLAAALLASSPAFACCDIPSPDMGAFFQQQPIQMPSYIPQQQAPEYLPMIPTQRSYHCRSYGSGDNWTTDCD